MQLICRRKLHLQSLYRMEIILDSLFSQIFSYIYTLSNEVSLLEVLKEWKFFPKFVGHIQQKTATQLLHFKSFQRMENSQIVSYIYTVPHQVLLLEVLKLKSGNFSKFCGLYLQIRFAAESYTCRVSSVGCKIIKKNLRFYPLSVLIRKDAKSQQ